VDREENGKEVNDDCKDDLDVSNESRKIPSGGNTMNFDKHCDCIMESSCVETKFEIDGSRGKIVSGVFLRGFDNWLESRHLYSLIPLPWSSR
jgi:hypothetical protein